MAMNIILRIRIWYENALLGHLAQDEEPLLNDLHLDGTADQDVTLVESLDEVRAVVVVRTIEAIEVSQGIKSAPPIEGK